MARSQTLRMSALLLLIMASACSVGETSPTATPQPLPTTTDMPTTTPSSTVTFTVTSSYTPTEPPTITLSPSHTATATPLPVTPSPTYTPSITFTPTLSTAVAMPVRELPVRSGPGLTYAIVGSVEADVPIPIYAMSDDGAWVMISSLGQDGRWLGLSPFVELGGSWENISVWGATPTSTSTQTPSPTATITPTQIPTVDVDAIVETVVAEVVATLSVPTAVPLIPGGHMDMSADDDPSLGPDDAVITIIEFGDLNDPYGKRFADETLPQILETYGELVRLVYRDFPILGDLSAQAAVAAECANDQQVYWKYQRKVWDAQEGFSRSLFVQIAEDLKLDMPVFFACLDDENSWNEVQTDANTAKTAGITGVPTFFINGTILIGSQPYEVFADVIDAALAEASSESE